MMGINAEQLRLKIIRPVLEHLDSEIPYSIAAENLVMGTCAQESDMGLYIVQRENGPAQGIFQMEPATEMDIMQNFLIYRANLEIAINLLVNEFCPDDMSSLTGNMYYAAAMCRVHYYRVPEGLPMSDDIEGLAHYYKQHYNTYKGKATVDDFIQNYNRYVI
jgi:hypothetical protein